MLVTLFILSGTAIAILLVAKRVEEKRRKTNFVLRLVSLGDTRVRELHHVSVHYYSEVKEKTGFFIKKQLPRYSKSSLNKIVAQAQERLDLYLESLRDSKLLKKSDGISEFFQTMSSVEKGAGEINEDIYTEEAPTTNDIQPATEAKVELNFEISEPIINEPVIIEASELEPTPEPIILEEAPKPKIKRARKPAAATTTTRRKLKVTSIEETL